MSAVRFSAILIILIAIILLPFWLYLPILGAGIIIFPFFWEGIPLALLVDVLYGGGIGPIAELLSPMAFVATLVLIVLLPLRERIRIHV